MAGKGRGVAAFTFNIEALGITRGCMPETQRGPTPLFPPLEFKPGPLKASESEDYMRALKQEIRGRMKHLPFNIKNRAGKGDLKKSPKISSKDKEEVLNKLDELEKKGDVKSDEEAEAKKKKEDEEEGEGEDIEGEYDEEELEEENDYIASYFEDGDEYGGSDDNMDEATY
ncbi:hypothetical protein DNTS_003828 [Danionella cerebrum]|uniref:DNA-directed RNA polymerase III subunit n=1 Tax=Danionella cerebrum TaxID=2873325 RepID=A0A553RK94_9TELE|nr:hypothetical protein DNTS_003828 [Danionella translucida]